MMRWKRDLIRVVFIIRHDLEKDFREVIGRPDWRRSVRGKMSKYAYAFQEVERYTGRHLPGSGRQNETLGNRPGDPCLQGP